MNKTLKLIVVAIAWPLGAALIGLAIFSTIYVEHGTIIFWFAGIFLGLIAGLVHVLLIIRSTSERKQI